MTIAQIFEKHEGEYLKFNRVEHKANARADLNAFILLEHLFPGHGDMVTAAEHDQIWLFPELEQIESLTEDQVIVLVRCGVRFDEYDSLSMFV